jgi:hypothetical protein
MPVSSRWLLAAVGLPALALFAVCPSGADRLCNALPLIRYQPDLHRMARTHGF